MIDSSNIMVTILLFLLVGGIDSVQLQRLQSDRNLADVVAIRKDGRSHNAPDYGETSKEVEADLKEQIKKGKEFLTAIVHIGPQKTGSKSIQRAMLQLRAELEQDNYAKTTDVNQYSDYSFTECFRTQHSRRRLGSPVDDITCHNNTLQEVQKISTEAHQNVIITSETLADFQINQRELYDFLHSHWSNVIIVAFYRRYFSWIVSIHYEQNKKKDPNHPDRVELVDFLNIRQLEGIFNEYYLNGALTRYRNANFENIKVYNLHNLGTNDNAAEAFYCDALPNATHACQKLKSKVSEEAREIHRGETLVYLDLAFYAIEKGWVTNMEKEELAEKAKTYQEETLQLSNYDWGNALKCPNDEDLDWLLKTSLEFEQFIFPQTSSDSLQTLREEFEKDRMSALCTVDAQSVLEERPHWQQFFQSL